MNLPGVACFQCDRIYDDLPDHIRADGYAAQEAILSHWVAHAVDDAKIRVAVLDTQIRPHHAQATLARLGIAAHRIVLVECEQQERNERLRGVRGQPELASTQMECWAAYLRGQADAMGLEIINTSLTSISAAAARLREFVGALNDTPS